MSGETVEKCENCRFWRSGSSAAEVWEHVGGMCHRYAPQGPIVRGDNESWQTFPPVHAESWCGDYRPKSDPGVGVLRAAVAA